MTTELVVEITRQAMEMTLLLVAPILGVGLIIGLLVSVVQAMTQLQEMTLTFIPKLLGVGIALVVLSPWMLEMMVAYTTTLIENIPLYIR
jgi:flagellar biosynthetic protein FliQ